MESKYISEGAAQFLYQDAQRYEDKAASLQYDADQLTARAGYNRYIAAMIRYSLVAYAFRILEDDGCPHHD